MEKKKCKKKSNVIFCIGLIVVMLGFIIAVCPVFMQNDVFWSIKVGEKLFKEGTWDIDSFSYHEGLTYVAHHFLTDIVIYLVYTLGSFTGLYILEIILAIIMASLLYVLNKEICKNKLLSYILLAIQMFFMSQFIAVRAQMFSYILFILELILLEKSRETNNKWYYIILALIPIVLVNFHMGVAPFYFVILGVYIIDTLKVKLIWVDLKTEPNIKRFKQLSFIFLIGIISLFINPYGIDGVLYPFKTLGNSTINSFISEFQPFALTSKISVYTLGYIFCVILVLMANNKKVALKDGLLIFGTLLMNFIAIRYISLYIICSVVILKYLKENLKSWKIDSIDIKCGVGTIVICMLILSGNMFFKGDKEYIVEELAPVKAIEIVKENMNADTVIFNEYEWGGYLILNDIPVFIDSRCDLYTQEYNPDTQVANDYFDLKKCVKEYKEILDKYDFDMFLVRTEDTFTTILSIDKDYKVIYEDEVASVYVKIK